jgi:hypothetical protein
MRAGLLILPFAFYLFTFALRFARAARAGRVVLVVGRVEPEDVLALARARVDGAQVLAPLHLPDGRHLPVLLDGVVSNLFGRCLRGLLLFAAFGRASVGRR